MRKFNILSLALAVIFGLSSLTPLARAEEKAGKVPSKAEASANQQLNQGVSGITQAAVKGGVLACTSRINQVATFLTAGTPGVAAMLFMPQNNPDQQLISVSMEIPQKEAASAYASASFAPNQANGCGGMYETVVYWSQKCDEVAGKNFSTIKKIEGFSKSFTVLDGGMTTKIFLMPAGKGCVSIKKEVIQ